MLVFKNRGKPGYSEKNLSGQRKGLIKNKLDPHVVSRSGNTPGPYYGEASGLTTRVCVALKSVTLQC